MQPEYLTLNPQLSVLVPDRTPILASENLLNSVIGDGEETSILSSALQLAQNYPCLI